VTVTQAPVVAIPPRRKRAAVPGSLSAAAILFVWLVVLLGFGIVVVVSQNRPDGPVLRPLAAALGVAALFYDTLLRRHRTNPFLNLGGFATAIIILYAVYPLLVFLGNHLVYTSVNDQRLFVWQPLPSQIGTLAWWYVAFLFMFCVSYLATAGRATRIRIDRATAPPGIIKVIVAVFMVTQLILLVTRYAFGLDPKTYAESFLVVWQLPHAVRQVFSLAALMQTTIWILLFCCLFLNYRRNRVWIALLLGYIVVTNVVMLGGRGFLFSILIVTVVLYHNLVRRISIVVAGVGGGALVAASTLMGALRQGSEAAGSALGSSEFEVILGNAYDLMFVNHQAGALLHRPALYFCDLAGMVPQQLLPFEKMLKADWYAFTFYPIYSSFGGGFAFGVLSEAISGFGLVEMFVRGALAGLICGWIQRSVTRGPISVWHFAFYLWMTITFMQVVRNTTFCLLPWAEYYFLVPVLAIRGMYYAASSTRRAIRSTR
jgi:hypothetical protein